LVAPVTAGFFKKRKESKSVKTLNVRVFIDQKAALLRGKILGDSSEIELGADTLVGLNENIRTALVGALEMKTGEIPTLSGLVEGMRVRLSDNTPEALIEEVTRIVSESAAFRKKREDRVLAKLAEPLEADIVRIPSKNYGYEWERWDIDNELTSSFSSLRSGLSHEQNNRLNERANAVWEVIKKHNDDHASAISEAKDKAAEAEAEAEAKAKAEAEAEAIREGERRLKEGIWRMGTGGYNHHRYGAYWCAKITFPSGPKPEYKWGESTGKWGEAGMLEVPCSPGEIIAYGQKDNRRPDKSKRVFLLMGKDGTMTEIDKNEAYEHSKRQR
jgi:hypothetical protein